MSVRGASAAEESDSVCGPQACIRVAPCNIVKRAISRTLWGSLVAKPKSGSAEQLTVSEQLLAFVGGVLVLPKDAGETEHLQIAARVGLSAAVVARMFGKSEGAAQKALERARKRRGGR